MRNRTSKRKWNNQINDRDGDADDEAERSGGQHEPEAPAKLELEDHVFQVNQQRSVGQHQEVELQKNSVFYLELKISTLT